MATTATTVRRITVTLPAVSLGPENPLPALRPLDEVHQVDAGDRDRLPADMARQIGYAPLRSVLPVRLRDGYGRDRAPAGLDAIAIENDRVRAVVLPGLGGRLYSLVHKPTGRELLYRNPVFQPANFALADAWFSGGVEWNLGATGHCAHTCAPLHAARLPAPDGGEMLRLWEWERLRDLPFQIDMWLPAESDFLYVGVRVRNPHDRTVPAYWWSNMAVPETEDTRVLAPADAAYHFDYTRALSRVPVPTPRGAGTTDITYTTRSQHAADYFFDIEGDDRRWIAALDGEGRGLVQTSTDVLRGRKLFLWGSDRGGRRWQEWLTEPGTGGYLEIQAGLARTQLEHIPMAPDSDFSWLEAYGPLAADPALVHGDDWAAARAETAGRLQAALPRETVDAAYAAWLEHADTEPKDILCTGSGWGALETERGTGDLPGTPFPAATLGDAQKPWLELLLAGVFPRPVADAPPGPALVAPQWRDLLESADTYPGNEWFLDYYLGVSQWAAGDRAQAVRSWERSVEAHGSPWALRALAVAEAVAGQPQQAADRYLAACASLREQTPAAAAEPGPAQDAARTVQRALLLEAVPALLDADRAAEAEQLLDEPAAGGSTPLEGGRVQLLRAQAALARGDAERARAIFDAGFTVENLREGDETLSDTWHAIAEALVAAGAPVDDAIRIEARAAHPLPAAYDFRMRPDASTS
ncbi:DUF5107 domain-containing protein [Actinacidiphila acidipaludis]|uniref:DUF5107 domain-containing protein n=1 Tax=Actinacidiphila acidipaludis TaxID=2873382 RepID=UPI00223B2650|nr:DUF5107 domain-containing protein [Streptomyces acidipaludis]